ncbi:class F sortase [Streptomyces sp. NPDC000410]|uniref:class F sortase n=1 Tax=Streptomyces sp. NPDC000410 TaxID=3154254 RepID=UPI003321C709
MPRTTRMPRTAAALSALVCVGSAALTGCSSADRDTSAAAVPRPSRSAPERPAEGVPADPVRLSIPSLSVDSALMPLGLNADGTVEVPPAERGMTAGWYTGRPVPGAPGAAVVIGHNDTRFGRAVFHDLKKIAKGADISVRDAKGATVHFTVTGTETVSKKSFPTEKVYGPTNGRALRLITCDGDFDAEGHPVDNLIVHAVADSG